MRERRERLTVLISSKTARLGSSAGVQRTLCREVPQCALGISSTIFCEPKQVLLPSLPMPQPEPFGSLSSYG